jgi:hypothetical protein
MCAQMAVSGRAEEAERCLGAGATANVDVDVAPDAESLAVTFRQRLQVRTIYSTGPAPIVVAHFLEIYSSTHAAPDVWFL